MTRSASLEQLKRVGFRRIGEWKLDADVLSCAIDDPLPGSRVLYAFVEGQQVLYIGKSVRTLQKRLQGYARPGHSQRTNLRANALIRETLGSERRVEVYAFVDPAEMTYAGMPVNLAAGLEDGLIDSIRPPWNKTGA